MRQLKEIENAMQRNKEEMERLQKEYENTKKELQETKYDFFGQPLKIGDKVVYAKTGPTDGALFAVGTFQGGNSILSDCDAPINREPSKCLVKYRRNFVDNDTINAIINAYRDYTEEHPIDVCWAEHAEDEDWAYYRKQAINYIKKQLLKIKND